MKKVRFALIITLLAFQSVFGQTDRGSSEKLLFRDSEKQIKEIYNELFAKLNDNGKQMLQEEQKEWINKRKALVSKEAQNSVEQANILVIKANLARVQFLKDALARVNPAPTKDSTGRLRTFGNDDNQDNDFNLSRVKTLITEGDQILKTKKPSDAYSKYKYALGLLNKSSTIYNQVRVLALSRIASSFELASNTDEALSYMNQALELAKTSFPPNDLNVAECMQSLGRIYGFRGQHQNAISMLQQALAIKQHALGPNNINCARLMGDIAHNYSMLDDGANALNLGQQSLAIIKSLSGDYKNELIQATKSLGNIYSSLSDYDSALGLFQNAMLLNEKQTPPDESIAAWLLEDIAGIYGVTQQYKSKIDTLNRALALKEKVFGPDSTFLSTTLQGLGNAYAGLGDSEKGISFLRESLAIAEKNKQQVGLIGINNDLGAIHQQHGNFGAALEHHKKALEISDRLYGPAHPITAATLAHIAMASSGAGDALGARASTLQWVNSVDNTMKKVLSLGEKQRLNWAANNLNFSLPVANLKPDKLSEVVLRWKGIVVDSLCEDRAIMGRLSTTDQGKATLQEITRLKSKIADLVGEHSETSEDEIRNTQLQIDAVESSVSQIAMLGGRARSSSSISVDQVAAKLWKNECIVDFITYFNPKTKTHFYGATIIDPNGEAKWAGGEECNSINEAIFAIRQGINGGGEEQMAEHLSYIYDHLWRAIEDNFPDGTNKVYIAPDGVLNLMSFAVLLDKNKNFLSERLSIAYLGSGRDLLRLTEKNGSKQIVVFADPEFNLKSEKGRHEVADKTKPHGIPSIQIPQLPGTRKEADYICREATAKGWSSEVHLGKQASKLRLAATNAPSILHMATHGFYLNPLGPAEGQLRGMKIGSPGDPDGGKIDNSGGIGVQFDVVDPHKRIIHVAPGSQAEKSGIKVGDEIISVDNQKTLGVSATRLVEMVRGASGTQVSLQIKHSGQSGSVNLSVTREPLSAQGPIAFADPMRASRLALAGAQTTLNHWNNGSTTSSENDGIVTAQDILSLNLNTTWLVTLSSCDSGVGHVQYGEGVFGLRRAFKMAGTQNLLTTLWPVSDSLTPALMEDFYREAFSSNDVASALANVQKNWLVKIRDEKGLVNAVRQAGPFVLSTTGSSR
jgi:CHAT domain-containing protein/lipopolysaccharide biosynthesis regulator YciM